ncbi:MAG: OmpA family protein [Saprospiraceae bacterium]|nr:OmpA family protein [Saprospiraceae bacterium]
MNKNFLLVLLLFCVFHPERIFAQVHLPAIAFSVVDNKSKGLEQAKEGSTSTASIFFETDQSELSAEALKTLDALAPALLQAPDYQVNIEAFTDDRGTHQYNLRLAADRAASVQTYLAAKGLIADKTAVQNWGERKAFGPTELGRQKSRRVDVAVNALTFNDFKVLRERLSANTEQVLKIKSGEEQTVTAAKGTLVVVPANAFVFEDGTAPKGEVDIIVQEAFDPSDFVLHNLTTMSEGRILQTGGMVCIKAQSGGRDLQLADGAALTVSIPNGGNFDPGMELFYAQPAAAGGVDWVAAGQTFYPNSRIGRASISIDPSLGKRIAALKVPEYAAPSTPSFKEKMRPEPKMPVAPLKPRAPQKPIWEEVQKFYSGGVESAKLSRKELKKAQQYFAERTAGYQRDSFNYIQLAARYQRNLAGYEKARANYAGLHQNWENELESRLKTLALYRREMKLHQYSRTMSNILKAKAKTITRYETYCNLYGGVLYTMDRLEERSMLSGIANKGAQQLSSVYDRAIGTKIIDNYPGYENLVWKANASLPKIDYHAIKNQMLESTGLRGISDSLQDKIREKQQQSTSKSLEQLNGMADGYFATVTQLGWINCDRFYRNPAPRLELVVAEKEEAALYAVCNDINAMLPLYRNDDGTYSVNGLPKGQKVTVIAIKLKDGMPQYAQRDLKVGDAVPSMVYRSLPLRDLKEELKKLNI